MSVYQITVTARGYYSQGGEMYEITLNLEPKTAMIEHFFSLKENNNYYFLHYTFWKNYAMSARTHKTVILTLEFSFIKISSLYGTDAHTVDITANQTICIG